MCHQRNCHKDLPQPKEVPYYRDINKKPLGGCMRYQVLIWKSFGEEMYENQPVIKTSLFDCYLEAQSWGESQCCQEKSLAYTIINLSL